MLILQNGSNQQNQSNERTCISSSTSTDDINTNQTEIKEMIKRTLDEALKIFDNEIRTGYLHRCQTSRSHRKTRSAKL